jgi:glutathione S-transferase
VALRIRAKVLGIPVDEATVARGEKALPTPLSVVERQLAKNKWMLGFDFSLVDCAYCPILNVVEKAGFSFGDFPRVSAYLETMRSRQTWKDTPKLPML